MSGGHEKAGSNNHQTRISQFHRFGSVRKGCLNRVLFKRASRFLHFLFQTLTLRRFIGGSYAPDDCDGC